MLYYLKDCHISTLKLKLIVLYALNILDLGLTLFLLQTGYILEVNPFMTIILADQFLIFTLKLLLPGLLFSYLFSYLQRANSFHLFISNQFILILILLYSFANALHLIWFFLLAHLY